MNPVAIWLLLIVFGYLMGSISFGIIVSKSVAKIDIRSVGSGNTGMTNVWRVLGMGPGAIVFVGDLVKGLLPAVIGLWFGGESLSGLVGVATMLGHTFPIFFGFRGGKGVATGVGICLVLQPFAVLTAAIAFAVTILMGKMVSLASLSGSVAALLYCIITRQSIYIICTLAAIVSIIFLRHIPNIKRIINGTEARISKK